MKNVRKQLKKFMKFCRKSLKKDLKSVLLFGSFISSPYKAKDIDIMVVLDDNSNKEAVDALLTKFIKEKLKIKNDAESVDLPFTEIKEDSFFNIVTTKESDIRSENLKKIFNNDKYLISFFVPSSLVLLSLKENHKVLFGLDEMKSWKINVNLLDYLRTLTRSISLSLFSIALLPFSIKKSFSLSCDSLKHLLQNCFILETGMSSKNFNMLLKFYGNKWWVDILAEYREGTNVNIVDKVKFILTLPIISIVIFSEIFI